MERRIRDATRRRERRRESPSTLFHFTPGQIVIRRHRTFSKLDPRKSPPYRVRSVAGVFRQRIMLEPIDVEGQKPAWRRRITVHAS